MMGNVGANVGRFRPADDFEGHGGTSLEARDREPLGGISCIKDLGYDGGGLDEKFG